jgi:ATP synthase protein I
MVRRALPYAVPAFVLAATLGTVLDGWGTGWSAALGVAVVVLNLVAHGLSLAWAARVSPTVVFAVGIGGFVVRMAAVLVILILLNRLPWFSPVAFVAAVVPATILLLIYEAKLLSGRMQIDLWTSAGEPHR